MMYRGFKYQLFVVFLLIAISTLATAQDERTSKRVTTDQLLDHLRSIKNPAIQPARISESFQDVKCGFSLRAQAVSRWKEFSPVQKIELSVLTRANAMQSDTIAGHFRVFYDTTGVNEPALLDNNNQRIPGTAKAYIHLVGQIFNHVWDVEIDQMGYSAPPFENGQSYYNIYVENVQDYGSTQPLEPQINGTDIPPRYCSYIIIDNDYQGNRYYTQGINGLKVTAAHEFHHAIQVGSYGLWENDLYVHELTSTWFEDIVYTDVNDYYQYLKVFFGSKNLATGFSQGLSFNSNAYGGYERCIFAHCFAKMFGSDIMKDIWTGMRTKPFLESTDAALVNRGSDLRSAFAEFTKWNYFTWDRADTVHYYPEGNHYPRFQPLQKIAFYNTTSTTSGSVYPLSSSMYEFDLPQDTITAIIANVDIGNAMIKNTTPQNIEVTLSSGLQTSISVDNLSLWRPFYMQSSTRTAVKRFQLNAAPNPFRLADAKKLLLPINEDNALWANVYIYNAALDLAYSAQLRPSYNDDVGTWIIEVPASEMKSKLSSGVYFVIAKTVSSEYKWKVAVIR